MQKPPRVALGGASRKEATREEVLNQAKAERAARNEAKRQKAAATLVQAAWRSHAARCALQRQLLHEWQAKYAAAAAQPQVLLPAAELQAGAVRLMLMALLPPGSHHSRQLLASGGPLLVQGDGAVMLRGTIALVLRSLGSQDPALSYYAAAAASPGSTHEGGHPWRVQAIQLCQLGCLVAATAGDSAPVLTAAASRLVQQLATASAAAERGGSSSGGANAGAPAEQPAEPPTPLGSAAAAAAVQAGLLAAPMPLLSAARRCVQQLARLQEDSGAASSAAPGSLSAASALAAGLQRLMSVVLLMLEAAQQQQRQQEQFLQQTVLELLTTPQLSRCLSAATKERLLDPAMLLQHLLPTVQRLASSGALTGLPAAHCMCNLAQLLTGCAAGQQQQQQQQQSPLSNGATAELYVRVAMQLLAASEKPSGCKQEHSGSVASALQEGCWMLGTQQHLLLLHRTLLNHSQQGIVLFAGYCVHLLGSAAAGQATAGAGAQALSSSVLNVLAFAPKLLPSLWSWLAHTAGLPLEAPLQATRGLDIAAVSAGPEGLPPAVGLVMGLFCRSLSQLLLVLDDADLHQHQAPFSVGASRAIASTLNSLVFHTSFPAAKGPSTQPQHQQAQQQPGQHPLQADMQQDLASGIMAPTFRLGVGLLRQYAPTALRGYYDRDARKQFCQPHLWTEPFSNLMATLQAQQPQAGGAAARLTAALVQALLVSSGLAGPEDGAAGSGSSPSSHTSSGISGSRPGPRAHDPAAMSAAAQGAHVPGLRTGALLSLLRAAPQCVPFNVRLELFRQMLQQDKVQGRWVLMPAEGGPRPIKLRVRRDALLEDAFRGLAGLGPGIKARLMVTFFNAQGLEEAGLDHGGLMKELLEQVVRAGCQPEYGLFAATEDTGLLYPNPAAEAIPQGLVLLEFLGMMVGKALYEGILLDLNFAPFFLRVQLGGRPGLDDLTGLDSALHSNLIAVKTCPAEDVEHLGLTFAAEQQLLGRTIQSNLLPDGDNIPVTGSNRLLYVHLLADWHLNARLGRAAAAFASGLSSVLPPTWLRMFSPTELNQLISGGMDGGLDAADMARHACYSNGYSESSHTIKLFWQVVHDMTPQQRSALLRFITSTSRAPLGGFKHLQPPLTIHKVDCGASPLALLGGKDVERLPSASTCFNTLKLPNYRRQATLKQKLLYAIGAGAGFELS